MTIRKLLVANRGEIAARIFRTCRRLGIETVAVAAPGEAEALHTRHADETQHVTSYLYPTELVRAAVRTGANAIHPGYGFLAENADFARAVQAAGVLWIGPPPDVIRRASDKLEAKRLATSIGVPTLATGEAETLGFPLLIKAAGGGGGRGMRVVHTQADLAAALEAASREAQAAFRDGTIFLERYLERPRHVEIQLLADQYGDVISLGERECSIQRRHQKVLEESPSPGIDGGLRTRIAESAVSLARAVGYENAGTAEFLVRQDEFFFLEFNSRIQVEHPVTEAVTGLDLIEWQLRLAQGDHAPDPPEPNGHAIEARLYAEHPLTFTPQTGRIRSLTIPTTVRVDAGVENGDEIPIGYDPLIAKIIAHASTRDKALRLLADALAKTTIRGPTTNLPFLRWLADHPSIHGGDTTTDFLNEHPPLSRTSAPNGPYRGYFRINRDPALVIPRALAPPQVEYASHRTPVDREVAASLTAPTPGTVVRVLVEEGDHVRARQPLIILEAMKMETPLLAPYNAIVRHLHATEGVQVAGGTILAELAAADGPSGA